MEWYLDLVNCVDSCWNNVYDYIGFEPVGFVCKLKELKELTALATLSMSVWPPTRVSPRDRNFGIASVSPFLMA